jgi:hypothetical protein
MERFILEFSVRAALLVAGTAFILYLTRLRAAAAKHTMWTVALAAMLVLPIWTGWGPKAHLRLLPPVAPAGGSGGTLAVEPLPRGSLSLPLLSTRQAVLLVAYLVVSSLLLLRLVVGTIHARRMLRNAVFDDDVRTSSLCSAPVTVGFFEPVVILPEKWRLWPEAQRKVVLMHEGEHARRRDCLVQWLALLNRALFWFHPAAWWLEHALSGLAEEACDDAVLARGYDPRVYAECLLDVARSVSRSGSRLNVAGMAMPGGRLGQRIGRILKSGRATPISHLRMISAAALSLIACTAFATGTLDHARRSPSGQEVTVQRNSESSLRPGKGYALGDLKVDGSVHDAAGVRDRNLSAWKNHEFDNISELTSAVAAGVRKDFQERGYFQVVVHKPASHALGRNGATETVLVTVAITEGDQFRLGSLLIQNVPRGRALSVSEATIRDQFHIHPGDLFNVTEMRAGMGRVKQLYESQGYQNAELEPRSDLDNADHRIDFTIRITEGPHKP